MKNPFHRHEWRTVAIDNGYNTTNSYSIKKHHQCDFLKCECGKRKLDIVNDSKYEARNSTSIKNHDGLKQTKVEWEEFNILNLTHMGSILYDHNYLIVKTGTGTSAYHYKPITEMGEILKMLEKNEEFSKLFANNMVKDAFDQLVTTISLHQGI
jgi:hypothetical protein